MVEAYSSVQHNNEDAAKPNIYCDNLTCKSKHEYLFIEKKGWQGWEERGIPGLVTGSMTLGVFLNLFGLRFF